MTEAMTDRAQWLQERKQGVGGSDCASLLNVGYGCRRRLWYEKVGVPEDYPDPPAKKKRVLDLGRAIEPVLADAYLDETHRFINEYDTPFIANDALLRVNIDRSVRESYMGGLGVLEIKAVSRGVYYTYKREGLPEDYILQLQAGMLATNWTWGAFCIGNRDSGEIKHWDVERSEAICAEILAEVPKFWVTVELGRQCSLSDVDAIESIAPPRLEPDDRRCQSCAWRRTCQGNQLVQLEPEGEIPQAEELRQLLAEYDARKELFAQAEELLDETKAQLMSDLGDRQAVKVGDRKVYYRPQEPRMLYDGKGLLEVYREALKVDATGRILAQGLPAPEKFLDKAKPSRPLRIY